MCSLTGKYIAYGISISNSKASIRIHDVDSDCRHRVDELQYPVADLAFVSSPQDLMLAAIDQKGNVIIYVLYFLTGNFHFDRYLEVTVSTPLHFWLGDCWTCFIIIIKALLAGF